MFPTIDQSNLPLLIPAKTAAITQKLQKDRDLTVKAALLTFYRSPAYALLERENTKLWHRSAPQIYAEYFSREPIPASYHHGPGHSKLEPFREAILLWRKRNLSLQEIVRKLQEQGCATTAQNLWKYLKNRGELSVSSD